MLLHAFCRFCCTFCLCLRFCFCLCALFALCFLRFVRCHVPYHDFCGMCTGYFFPNYPLTLSVKPSRQHLNNGMAYNVAYVNMSMSSCHVCIIMSVSSSPLFSCVMSHLLFPTHPHPGRFPKGRFVLKKHRRQPFTGCGFGWIGIIPGEGWPGLASVSSLYSLGGGG